MVGDTFQMTRGQNKLQTGADQPRLAGHALELTFKDAVAILVDGVVAFEHRCGHLDVAGNERPKAVADHGAHGRGHGRKFFRDLGVRHFAKRDDSLRQVYGQVADALQIIVELQHRYNQTQFLLGKRALAKQTDGLLIDDNLHFIDARLEKKHFTGKSGGAGIVGADDGIERAVHGTLNRARHGNQIVHERVKHERFGRSGDGGHRSPLKWTRVSTLQLSFSAGYGYSSLTQL